MSNKAIIEWNDGEIVAIHKVHLPSPGESGFYRPVTSFEGFHNRELNRNFPATKYASGSEIVRAGMPEGRWFGCSLWEDFERNLTDDLKPLIVEEPLQWRVSRRGVGPEEVWCFSAWLWGRDRTSRSHIAMPDDMNSALQAGYRIRKFRVARSKSQ